MTEAHTLRGLSGMDNSPGALKDAALVMIDCQNTYLEGIMTLVGIEDALAEAAVLLGRARDAGAAIIHIAHDSGPGSPYDYSSHIGQIADPVAPGDGESVIIKGKPNAFFETDLHEQLQAAGKQNLVLAGFMTHMCVNSTARAAFNLGYRTIVVGAATATRDLPGRDGGVMPAATLQAASLAALSDLFAIIVDGADDLSG